MLGKDIIDYIENKFTRKEGFTWLSWLKIKKDIYPDHKYPFMKSNVTWEKLKKNIEDVKIKKSLEDIC